MRLKHLSTRYSPRRDAKALLRCVIPMQDGCFRRKKPMGKIPRLGKDPEWEDEQPFEVRGPSGTGIKR